MTTYDWPTIRASTIFSFGGDAPRAELEQRVMDIFEQHPLLVVKAIDVVTKNYEAGKVRSPWAILDLNLKEAVRPGAELTVTDSNERQKRISRAEQWVRTTGAHFDRETEILEELFGDRGLLRDYAQIDLVEDTSDAGKWKLSEPEGDTGLVERMLKLYNEFRPKGIAIEEDAVARAEKFKTQNTELQAALSKARTEYRKPLPDVDYAADPTEDAERTPA